MTSDTRFGGFDMTELTYLKTGLNRVIREADRDAVTPLLVALDREVDREINSRTIAGDDAATDA